MDAVEITELEKIDADRVDGVGAPASGIPILLMKAVGEPAVKADGSHPPFTGSHKHAHPAFGGPDGDGDGAHEHDHDHDGDADHHHSHAAKATFDREAAKALVKAIVGRKVDESPDIAGGTAVLAQIADLIIAEAQELKSGQAGEICDIQQLACAAEMIWCWRTGEEAAGSGSVMPATTLAQSAADDAAKADLSAEGRRKSADAGHALPDGSYPIENVHDLHSAAVLARSGHGDVAAARRLIARRAKELGVANPLDDDKDDASKSEIAKGATDVDTVTQGSDDLDKAVADAIAKATAPLEKLRAELEATLAKVKATPVHGGPVMSAAAIPARNGPGREDKAAKAQYFRDMADTLTADPAAAEAYRRKARELDREATALT